MKLVTRKTRKAINKSLRKAIKRHGPALVAGVAGGVASALATLANTDAPGTDGKSNLTRLAENIQGAFNGDRDTRKHHDEKKTRPDADAEPLSEEHSGAPS